MWLKYSSAIPIIWTNALFPILYIINLKTILDKAVTETLLPWFIVWHHVWFNDSDFTRSGWPEMFILRPTHTWSQYLDFEPAKLHLSHLSQYWILFCGNRHSTSGLFELCYYTFVIFLSDECVLSQCCLTFSFSLTNLSPYSSWKVSTSTFATRCMSAGGRR